MMSVVCIQRFLVYCFHNNLVSIRRLHFPPTYIKMKFISSIVCASLATSAVAFAPSKQSVPTVSLEASFDPLNLAEGKTQNNSVMKFASTAAASLALSPLAAIAGKSHISVKKLWSIYQCSSKMLGWNIFSL